jgi:hypothetical protein
MINTTHLGSKGFVGYVGEMVKKDLKEREENNTMIQP